MATFGRAKINLFLSVGARRSDGYHSLETIFQPLALHDVVSISEHGDSLVVECPGVPQEQNNAAKAISLVLEQIPEKWRPEGIYCRIEKKIPLAGGIGGSSADIGAAIIEMNSVFDLGLSTEKMVELSAKIGADGPISVLRKTSFATGRGDDITAFEDELPKRLALIACPEISFEGHKTKMLYNYMDSVSLSERAVRASFEEAKEAVRSGWDSLVPLMFNSFEVYYERNAPVFGEIKSVFSRNSAPSLLAGSGPTVFGLFESRRNLSDCKRNFEEMNIRAIETSTL